MTSDHVCSTGRDWTEYDLTGLVVVITGATPGRGLSASQTLVADGAPKEMAVPAVVVIRWRLGSVSGA